MLTYDLSPRGKTPLYEYLYTLVRRDILSGALAPDTRLPSKRELAGHLSVSVTTVENAYAQLLLEGYLYSRPGAGFYVNHLDGGILPAAPPGPPLSAPVPCEDCGAPEEREYLVDFKANKCSHEHFPYSIWSRLMRETLARKDVELLRTIPYNGVFPLRKAIADYLYQSRGMRVNPEQIIIGAGTEYLYGRLLQLFGPESIIAIEDPGYKKFSEISSSHGILWDYIPIDESGMRSDRLSSGRANVVHVSPANHFPTGIVMPIQRRLELLKWASAQERRYLIEDDYDSELRYAGKPIPTMFSIDTRNKVVYMNTFSKSLVPSIRIGYLALPPYLVRRYRQTLSFYSCTVSAFEQLTLARFIAEGHFERHISRLKQSYKKKRDSMLSAIRASRLSRISAVQESNAGTHFLLRMNTALSDEEIKQAAESRSLHLALLSDYSRYRSLRNAGTLVVNYAGIEPEKIPLAVGLLEEIFQTDLSKNN